MKMNSKKHTVALMSKVLNVSRSGYYKWLKNLAITTNKADTLNNEIKSIFRASNKTYGSPRITFVNTTDSNHEYKIADNLLDRKFDVQRPNTVWVSDIEGFPKK